MPTYVQLVTFTPQGARNVKESPARLRQAREAIEQAGGRFIASYYTQGRYNLIVINEMPDEQTALSFSLGTLMQGNVTTETLRAFTPEEFAAACAKLPPA